MQKYQDEKEALCERLKQANDSLSALNKDESNIEEFIRQIKKYTAVEELDRAMCLQLIDYITIGARVPNDEVREIHIYYKLLGKFEG